MKKNVLHTILMLIVLCAIPQTAHTIESTSCALKKKNAYKSSISESVYYITENCTKQLFPNEAVFFSYFKSWDNVILIDDLTLRFIPNDPDTLVSPGNNYPDTNSGNKNSNGSGSGNKVSQRSQTLIMRDGSIIKSREKPAVYIVINNVKFHIQNSETLHELGIPERWIEIVSQKTIDAIPEGTTLNMYPQSRIMSGAAPNFMIFKDKNSNALYRVEPSSTDPKYQVLRKIANEGALKKTEYRLDRIPSVSIAEIPELSLIGIHTKTIFRIGTELGNNSTISYGGTFEEITQERQKAKNDGAFLRNEKYENISFEYPKKFKVTRGFSYGGAFRDEYSVVLTPPKDETSALSLTVIPAPKKISSYTTNEKETLISNTHFYPTGFELSEPITVLNSSGDTKNHSTFGFTRITHTEYSNGLTEKRITFIYKNNIFTGVIRQHATRGTELEELMYFIANTFTHT